MILVYLLLCLWHIRRKKWRLCKVRKVRFQLEKLRKITKTLYLKTIDFIRILLIIVSNQVFLCTYSSMCFAVVFFWSFNFFFRQSNTMRWTIFKINLNLRFYAGLVAFSSKLLSLGRRNKRCRQLNFNDTS